MSNLVNEILLRLAKAGLAAVVLGLVLFAPHRTARVAAPRSSHSCAG